MAFDVSLSTMWAIGRFQSLANFFTAAKALGFARFELNHAVNSAMLDGLNLNGQRITSIHEPCPADVSTQTLKARDWLVSSPDEECRRQGVRAVQRSIDLAQEIGAGAIVVHAGRVNADSQPYNALSPRPGGVPIEQELRALIDTRQAHTPTYHERKERLVAARAARAEAHLDAVRRSLVELAAYAGRAGMRLGLENRFYYLDIPLLDEMGALLDLVDDERIGFWYDVGHAQSLERLGFDTHEEWLRRYARRMIGAHLHDIKGLRDHYAAGLGETDWDMVAAHLPAGIIRTCEFRDDNTPEQVAAGLEFLVSKGCIQELGSRE